MSDASHKEQYSGIQRKVCSDRIQADLITTFDFRYIIWTIIFDFVSFEEPERQKIDLHCEVQLFHQI